MSHDGNDDALRRKAQADERRIDAEIQGIEKSDPFVAAVRATRMPMIITNPRLPDNPTVFVNDAFCRMSGYERDEIIGRNCRFLQGPETDAADVRLVREAIARREAIQHDIRNHRKDGSGFWNRLLLAPVFDATGELVYFFGSQVDVTIERDRMAGLENHNAALTTELVDRLRQQEQAEQKLLNLNQTLSDQVDLEVSERLKAEELLRQAQKMEAVGQLTGGLAHDFNNLLTGIAGSLEMLESKVKQGKLDRIDRYIGAARDAANRAAALTHRLLAFSRRQTLEPVATDVNQLAHGMKDLITRTIGPSIELILELETDIRKTLVDKSQLENSLLNLCINARDAMPDGGVLTIETRDLSLTKKEATIYDLKRGDYVSLAVTDTGTGMPAEVIARAFEPFYTTKPIGSGTGLGLSMIYGFAQQSGGQVRIHSTEGEGTTVRIYLPAVDLDEVSEGNGGEDAEPLSRGAGRILVVDDEPTIRLLMTDMLTENGYEVLEAGTGGEGLRLLNSGDIFDVLVTDVGLPGGMNGRQLADAARVHRPDLKVLFITGYADKAVLDHQHFDAGMHIMTKPFNMAALCLKIQEMTKM